MNTCKTCIYRNKNGHCTSEKIQEDWGQKDRQDALIYSYSEGGRFEVGPDFGCVHHSVISPNPQEPCV